MISLSQFVTRADLGLPPLLSAPVAPPPASQGDLLHDAHEFMIMWEGFRTAVYPDPGTGGAPWTVGAGLTYKPDDSKFKPGEVYAVDQLTKWAETILARDFIPEHKNWDKFTKGQKMALISFGWNNGAGFVGDYDKFASINRIMDDNDWNDARRVFGLYSKAGGKLMLGLQRRRYSEYLLSTGVSIQEAYRLGQALN